MENNKLVYNYKFRFCIYIYTKWYNYINDKNELLEPSG